MSYSLCRVLYDFDTNKVKFDSTESRGLTLAQIIENDKQYGTMKPANGKYFTFTVVNEDVEFTTKQTRRAVNYGYMRWKIWANLPRFKYVKPDYDDIIDFRIEFRDVETDPDGRLTANTVMYHYYPISNINSRFRGLCVANKAFFFTSHGDSVKGKFMKEFGILVQLSDGDYGTLDFDTIYGHEFGHGIGLPHDPEEDNIMAFRVDLMSEFASYRDSKRVIAKYGKRKMSSWRRYWFLKWLFSASDRR